MSAVLEQQGTLAGIEPVQTPALGQDLRLATMGVLVHGAQVRLHDDRVHVDVLVRQQVEHHPHALSLFGSFAYPDQGCIDSTLSAARKKAHAMAAGVEVMLVGRGLEIGRHEGLDVFRVLHVDALDITND